MKTIKCNKIFGGTFIVIVLILVQSCKEKSSKTSIVLSEKENYMQVATGQINAYDENGIVVSKIKPSDSLYGQDAHYLIAKKMSFKKINNGTITDNNTGLMWQ